MQVEDNIRMVPGLRLPLDDVKPPPWMMTKLGIVANKLYPGLHSQIFVDILLCYPVVSLLW